MGYKDHDPFSIELRDPFFQRRVANKSIFRLQYFQHIKKSSHKVIGLHVLEVDLRVVDIDEILSTIISTQKIFVQNLWFQYQNELSKSFQFLIKIFYKRHARRPKELWSLNYRPLTQSKKLKQRKGFINLMSSFIRASIDFMKRDSTDPSRKQLFSARSTSGLSKCPNMWSWKYL